MRIHGKYVEYLEHQVHVVHVVHVVHGGHSWVRGTEEVVLDTGRMKAQATSQYCTLKPIG